MGGDTGAKLRIPCHNIRVRVPKTRVWVMRLRFVVFIFAAFWHIVLGGKSVSSVYAVSGDNIILTKGNG